MSQPLLNGRYQPGYIVVSKTAEHPGSSKHELIIYSVLLTAGANRTVDVRPFVLVILSIAWPGPVVSCKSVSNLERQWTEFPWPRWIE